MPERRTAALCISTGDTTVDDLRSIHFLAAIEASFQIEQAATDYPDPPKPDLEARLVCRDLFTGLLQTELREATCAAIAAEGAQDKLDAVVRAMVALSWWTRNPMPDAVVLTANGGVYPMTPEMHDLLGERANGR